MKNHIIFKFIAVLLCAASLLGTLGGILGVALLTESGLYDQTVSEMVGTQISQDSAEMADWLAKNYASTEWGGASEALVQARYGSHWFSRKYNPSYYGYTISDAEGNELLSFHPELRDRQDLYAREQFSISGTYLHVVGTESLDSRNRRQKAEREQLLGDDVPLDSDNVIPAEGVLVDSALFVGANQQPILEIWYSGGEVVAFSYTENNTDGYSIGSEALGFLFYSPQGNLIFHSGFDYQSMVGDLAEQEVYEAYFTFRDGQVRLLREETVGRIYLNEHGHLMFLSQSITPAQTEEETLPEATEATVPETTVETAPPETLPEETAEPEAWEETQDETWEENQEEAWEETWNEEENSSASAVPEELPQEETWLEETIAPAEETPPAEAPVPEATVPVETLATDPTEPAETLPETINGKPLKEYQTNTQTYYDPQQDETMSAEFVYLSLPELSVEIYMTEAALRYGNGYEALALLRQFRNFLLPGAGLCLLLFAIFGVYLCTAAGRTPRNDEVRAGGLNRLPLDLYLLGGCLAAACAVVFGQELFQLMLEQDFWAAFGVLTAIGGIGCLLVVGFCFAFVAQIKTPGGFWWRNTVCGRVLHLCIRAALWTRGWLADKVFPFCGAIVHRLWQYTMVAVVCLYKVLAKATDWLGRNLKQLSRRLRQLLHRFLKLLPITWQWILSGVLILFFCTHAFRAHSFFLTLVCLLIPAAIILYGAHCYGTLAESARRMSKGDLNIQVDDSLMVGCFKNSAEDLNALADVAALAAQNQLKSERMKTELITNVSHDIKTPLTSIINYVDLLRKPHSEQEAERYLEVLERQSQQLKKLIDDLMDMSKAQTGNMQVEITTVDAVETVNQALGEFSDKLDRAGLTAVFRHTEAQIPMRADGRLAWRVLSNLLSNAVKYAMPGTRLYVDLMELEGNVVLSLKNISREELRFTSEELMSRFVRGDASRNTEGSGLGLNIAQSLMQLQKGQLHLLVDGDLFKVTLVFPGAEM